MAIYAATKDIESSKNEDFMEKLSKALGSNIRAMRKLRKFSQDGLALQCGLDRSYMGRIERGEVNLTVEKLYRIADKLHCEPSELLPSLLEINEIQ